MIEYLDVVDSNGRLTGKVIARGDKLEAGEYRQVAHVWILDEKDNHLIQKRSLSKQWKPGFWATTGGSVLHGETALQAAVRETEEETGIRLLPEQLKLIERIVCGETLIDVWAARIEPDQERVFTPNEEVDSIDWVPVAEIKRMIEANTFVDYWKEELYKTELDNIK